MNRDKQNENAPINDINSYLINCDAIDKNNHSKYTQIQKKLNAFGEIYKKDELLLNGHGVIKNIANIYKMYLPFINEGNYLELGCGSGMLANFLRTFSSKKIIPYGIDLNAKAIQLAKRNNVEFSDNFIVDDFYQTLNNREFDFEKYSTINMFFSLKDGCNKIKKLIAPIIRKYIHTSFIITDFDYDFIKNNDKQIANFIEEMNKISTVSIVCHPMFIVGNNTSMHKMARYIKLDVIKNETNVNSPEI